MLALGLYSTEAAKLAWATYNERKYVEDEIQVSLHFDSLIKVLKFSAPPISADSRSRALVLESVMKQKHQRTDILTRCN